MNNFPAFFVYIIFFFVLLGWICSEIVSRKSREIEAQYIKRLKLLKKEKSKLETSLAKQKNRCTQIEKGNVPLRESIEMIPALKKDHKNLSSELTKFHSSIDLIRSKLSNREYSSNPIASEALTILEEFCPNEEERKALKQFKMTGAFTRIKKSMENNLPGQ